MMTHPEQRSDGTNRMRRNAARGRWSLRTLGGALALTSLCGLAGSPVEGTPAAMAAGVATVKKDAAKGAAPRLALLVGVGRYGTSAGYGNGANYLIDFGPTVLNSICERRWSQDKVEIPASVQRRVGSEVAPVPVSGSVLKGRASISVPV